MCEAARNEKLTLVLSVQLDCNVLSEGRRTGTDIHGHVKHPAAHYAQQLGLGRIPFLEMEAAQHTPAGGIRLVVLHEIHRSGMCHEIPKGE